MRRSNFFYFLLICLSAISFEHLSAQTLQVTLSPDKSKINRSTSNGIATIFFDSSIEDLSIVCTEENPNEPITKINDHQWFVNIDVRKDIEMDGICYRNFLIKSAASAEYYLTTDTIAPNQVLYYTIALPNELEPKLLQEKSRFLASKAIEVANKGIFYLARKISMEALDYAYTTEADAALRYACPNSLPVLRNHSRGVCFVDFSPDDKQIVSTGCDRSTFVWDVSSGFGTKINEITGTYASGVSCFSPDGKHILTAGFDVKVFDAQSLKLIKVLDIDDFLIYSASYSPDGKSIFVATNKRILIYDASTFCLLNTLNTTSDELSKRSFSPDGKKLCCFEYEEGQVVEINSGKKLYSIPEKSIDAMSFSPDGKLVATVSFGIVKLWDSQSGVLVKEIKVCDYGVFDIAFSPDGKFLASASWNDIRLWDVLSGRLIKEFSGHEDRITSLVFSHDGERLVSCSWDKTVRIWDLVENQYAVLDNTPSDHYSSLSPDGEKRAVVSWGNPVEIINEKTGETIFQLPEDTWQVHTVDFSPDSKTFITSSQDGTARIWSAIDGKELKVFEHDAIVYTAVFSPDGLHVATGADKKIQVWNLQTDEVERTINTIHWIYKLAYSPDGHYLACLLDKQKLRLYNTQTWTRLFDYDSQFSSNNSILNFEKDKITIQTYSKTECWDFPSFQTLIDRTRKEFMNCPITEEEKDEYNLE